MCFCHLIARVLDRCFLLVWNENSHSWSQLPVPRFFVHFSPSLKYQQKLCHFKAFVKRVITSFISLFPLCFICLTPLACSLPLSLWFQLLLSFFVLMRSKKIYFYADASTRERWEVIYSTVGWKDRQSLHIIPSLCECLSISSTCSPYGWTHNSIPV